MADKELERSTRVEPFLDVAGRHGELIKVRNQAGKRSTVIGAHGNPNILEPRPSSLGGAAPPAKGAFAIGCCLPARPPGHIRKPAPGDQTCDRLRVKSC